MLSNGAGLIAAFLLFACRPPSARALYEDEVGQYEWHARHIGQSTALGYSPDAPDRVLVASAAGVVSSVALKDGSVQWRRIASEEPIRFLRARGKLVVSATEGGLTQGWKASSGDLTWQRSSSDGRVVALFLAGPASKQSAVVVHSSEVEARSASGKHEWSLSASAVGRNVRFQAAVYVDGSSTLCAIASPADGSGAMAVSVDIESGTVSGKAELPAIVSTALKSNSFVVADSSLIFLKGDVISAYRICEGGAVDSYELKKLKSSSGVAFELMPWQHTSGVFAATNGDTTGIFGLGPKGLRHLRSFEGRAVVGPVFSVHDDEGVQPVAVAITRQEGVQIQLLDPASGNVQPAIHAEGFAAADHGSVRLLLVRELSSGEHRTVLSAADHSLAGIQGKKVVWAREEALASIRHAFIYGRPVAPSTTKELKDPMAAMSTQLAELPVKIGEFMKQPLELLSALGVATKQSSQGSASKRYTSQSLPTSRDELKRFDADKLVIAVTKSFKIFALEATSSEIIWQKFFGSNDLKEPSDGACADLDLHEESMISAACGIWARLLPPSTSSLSELIVVLPTKGGPSKHEILWIDPLAGDVLHREATPEGASIISIMEIPLKVGRRQQVRPLLIVDDAHNSHTMPASAVSSDLLEDSPNRLFHYEVDRVASSVQGFVIGKPGTSPNKLMPLWNVELGSVGQKILTSTTPAHREWDNVPVYIKGDASILYKYINDNMLALASVDTLHKGNMSSLNVYAMDTVTGHVLHQSRIVGGSAPVHLVACDNFMVMHYWNLKKTRFEITVIELFQAKADDGPWNILFGQSSVNRSMSAHYLETPVPLQQTYIAPAGVTSLGVTATLKGITPRSIIMALTTDHILRVSKDQLNPRRPYTTGNKDSAVPPQFAPTKDEIVPPYAPVMAMRPTDVLSHYNTIGRVEGIVSSPTALESTSLVFCYGLDLFFTPVQTARAYDVLSPGFNYRLLYASCGAVGALFFVTTYIARYKALQERWK